MKVPPTLKAQTFGMPRWLWLALLAGGVGVGLYLRSKKKAEAEGEAMAAPATEATGEALAEQQETGGLAGVGVVGPAQGSITPVASPTIPEGFTDVFASLGEVIGTLANGIVEKAGIGASTPPTVPVDGGGGGGNPGEATAVAPGKQAKPKPKAAPTGGGPPNKKPGQHNNPANPGGGGGGNPKPAPVSVGPAQPVQQPTAQAHPQAVDTGNPCVKGGVGGHTAPPGYHLFCGGNGHIWRAPNS